MRILFLLNIALSHTETYGTEINDGNNTKENNANSSTSNSFFIFLLIDIVIKYVFCFC